MASVGAPDVPTYTLRAFGHAEAALDGLGLPPDRARALRAALQTGGDLRAAAGDAFERWVSAARVANAETYADRVLADPRYAAPRNSARTKKVGSKLELFDCLTCDKCIPVCPNDANFSLPIAIGDVAVERLVPVPGGFSIEADGVIAIAKPRQIANFADACNACGHCDVMCPEDGGPYVVKPRFFGSVAAWAESPELDGFALEPTAAGVRAHARFGGRAVVVETGAGRELRYRGEGFDLGLDPADPAATAEGSADGPVDLTWLRITLRVMDAVHAAGPTNWVGAALEAAAARSRLPLI
jgi:putative selenate reductase